MANFIPEDHDLARLIVELDQNDYDFIGTSSRFVDNSWSKILQNYKKITPSKIDIYNITYNSKSQAKKSLDGENIKKYFNFFQNLQQFSENGVFADNCGQILISNWTLNVQAGYVASKNSCLKCDYLDGPFLARVETLYQQKIESVASSIFMSPESMHPLSIFMKPYMMPVKINQTEAPNTAGLKVEGAKIASKIQYKQTQNSAICPGVMFTQFRRKKSNLTFEIRRIAEILQVSEVSLLDERQKFSFTCQHVNLPCRWRSLMSQSLPPCCLKFLTNNVHNFLNILAVNGILAGLAHGNLFGSIKNSGSSLPWDTDMDLPFLKSDTPKLSKLIGKKSVLDEVKNVKKGNFNFKNRHYLFDGKGYRNSRVGNMGEFHGVHVDSYSRELWEFIGKMENLDSGLLASMENLNTSSLYKFYMSTKTYLNGILVPTLYHPVLSLQLEYGKEIYQHVEHTKDKHGYFHLGYFHQCYQPGHHACLDQRHECRKGFCLFC